MNLLLDTHIALWAVTDDARLRPVARDHLNAPEVRIFVSVVTIWEIAIKHPLKRRGDPIAIPGRRARELFGYSNFTILPVTAEHAAAVDDLPPIHGDPFDRMLVAQALTEPMRLLTRDARLTEYGKNLIIPA